MKAPEVASRRRRIAVVGLGHELRGDDAAGIAVARGLQAALDDEEGLLVIAAGEAPENYTGPLRHFDPDQMLFVDAAQMDEVPGAIRWLSWRELDGSGPWTHALSPQALGRFLIDELGCAISLIGIQPAGNEIGSSLSPEVANAVDTVVLRLLRILAQDWVLGPAGGELAGPALPQTIAVLRGMRD